MHKGNAWATRACARDAYLKCTRNRVQPRGEVLGDPARLSVEVGSGLSKSSAIHMGLRVASESAALQEQGTRHSREGSRTTGRADAELGRWGNGCRRLAVVQQALE